MEPVFGVISHRPRFLGMLVLVVGPSGAGKDSLLAGAREFLAGDGRFRFVRRVITRPAEAGGEDHVPASDVEFARQQAEGGFALDWQAHGLHYGIPADIAVDLARGGIVIANVSRTVIATARSRYPTQVIEVTAPADILRQRLLARGREGAEDIARRIARAAADGVPADALRIVNDASLADGVTALTDALNRAAEFVWQCQIAALARIE